MDSVTRCQTIGAKEKKAPAYRVYIQCGIQTLHDYTEEQFEKIKRFYNLEQSGDSWRNKRGDIYAWKLDDNG